MTVTRWEQFDIENKVTTILRDIAKDDPQHYGQPFFTAYQLAIEFANRYPQEFTAINLPVGGQGTGQQTSLAQYIALELSRRIKSGSIQDIGIAFVHTRHVQGMTFKYDGGLISASAPGTQYDISIFRLIR